MKSTEDHNLYLFTLACSLLYLLKAQAYWTIPSFIYKPFSLVALLMAMVIAFGKIEKYKPHEIIFLSIYFLVSVVVGHNADLMFRLLLSVFLIIGAKEVPYQQIFKIYFIVGTAFFVATITAFSLGLIEQSVMDSGIDREMTYGDVGVRYSLGYTSATDLANHFLYVLVAYWLYRKGRLKWVEIAVIYLLVAFVFKTTGSRLSFLCSNLLILFAVYFKFKAYISNYIYYTSIFILLILSILLIPLSVYFTYNYSEDDITYFALDMLFSGRLSLGNDAINEYGFSFLGQYVEMVGCVDAAEGIEDTNYIDNSYIQLLVIHGFVYAFFILGSVLYFVYRSLKQGFDYAIIAVIISILEGVVAQHFMLIEFTPLLLSYTVAYSTDEKNMSSKKLERLRKALLLVKYKNMIKKRHAIAPNVN